MRSRLCCGCGERVRVCLGFGCGGGERVWVVVMVACSRLGGKRVS